jgi:hypothetical protein
MVGAADPGEDATAFVREVLMPGGPWQQPRLEAGASAFRLRLDLSRIHRWGVYADQDIPARRRVIEYTGQRIGLREGFRRRLRQQLYLFRGSARFPDDPNHRFTTNAAVYNAFVAQGWDGEGVNFCVPTN